MTLPSGPTLGQLALGELQHRRARAQSLRDARRMTAAQANDLLRPWAALALRLSDDPTALVEAGELSPLMEQWQVLRSPGIVGNGFAPHRAAIILARDICDYDQCLEALAHARDAAIAACLRHRDAEPYPTRARPLVILANALGCRGTRPEVFFRRDIETERKAA